ncbi:hypothetical protein P4G95_24855 [Burkholderia vietnamiensis]|uniref:hypothetical protein n=1 Tax=Burkholderia vietnamiensis TaxID=60552 RepID=UPI000AC50D7E|nr:hypothetical protein [Burkholderia vietnamiensis]MBE0628386.1 hypothetical protein [Burkholderia vietnamiensis]MBR8081268.1 hypothetical protein [Burkholderia vietnamiensis]MCA7942796.1 hypothetical protein [Burkholderia vietnamiensis]MDN8110571.1 hypothetical protein [Burkholderia vietnamiensis]WHU94570.1 hypothetical protein P4G95_24855 [Burkholderia vietnamiensis]
MADMRVRAGKGFPVSRLKVYGVEASPAAERDALAAIEQRRKQRDKVGTRTVAYGRTSLR